MYHLFFDVHIIKNWNKKNIYVNTIILTLEPKKNTSIKLSKLWSSRMTRIFSPCHVAPRYEGLNRACEFSKMQPYHYLIWQCSVKYILTSLELLENASLGLPHHHHQSCEGWPGLLAMCEGLALWKTPLGSGRPYPSANHQTLLWDHPCRCWWPSPSAASAADW